MLKKIIAPMALAVAGVFALAPINALAAPSSHHDTAGSHWYIGGGIGSGEGHSSSVIVLNYGSTITDNSSSSGAALRLFGGWRYANRHGDAIGIGLTDTGVSLGGSSAAGILGLDVNAMLHLVGPWFVSGRVGGYSGRDFDLSGDTYTYGDSQEGLYYGIGTGIDINDSNALSIGWDRYQVDDSTETSYGASVRISDTYVDVYMLSYTYTF